MQPADAPAVILAAGEGRRLAPLTNTRPKPMLPVANRPLLEYVLEAVVEAGIEEVVFVVGYRQERIRNHFGDGDDWGVAITYVEQATQLGTGHAILQVEDVVDGPFLVLNGDRIVEPSIVEAVGAAYDGRSTISTTQVKHPSTFGVVDLAGDRLVSIEEKPLAPSPTATINAGVYAFPRTIFDAIRETEPVEGELTITAVLDRLADDPGVDVVKYDGRWLDVTHQWDLLVVNAAMVDEASAPTASTDGSAAVADDVALADGVRLGPNATVAGGTAIGPHARVGANATVENAVVLQDAEIEPGAVVVDAIVGANARVGANATIEGGTARVIVDDEVHDGVTLGGVVGDNADLGGASVLAPGTIVGDGATVAAGARLSGTIAPGARVERG